MQQVGVWRRLAAKSPIQEIAPTVVYGNTSGELHLPASGSAGRSSTACRLPPRPNATATRWRSASNSPASTPARGPGLRLHKRRDFASARFPDTSPPLRYPRRRPRKKPGLTTFSPRCRWLPLRQPLEASQPPPRKSASVSPRDKQSRSRP